MRFSIFSVTDHHPEQPRTLRQFYTQLLDEIVLAEQLGFSAFFLAEHHFHEYGIVPAPPILLAAARQQTKRIGLGVAASVLPFHHPLALAEEYAMLDQLTDGRVVLGVGSGYLKHEYEGFSISPAEKRDRFDEALTILVKAWEGKPFSYYGLHHHVEQARIAVTPLQKPHPPLWIAILRPEAAYYIGKQGRNIMLIPYASSKTRDDLKAIVDEYLRGFAESGAASAPDIAVAFHTYVSADSANTRAESEAALDRYVQTRLYAKQPSYDELDAAGLFLFGDAAQVTQRIKEFETIGINHIMILPDFGALEAQRVRVSIGRFAREVMPGFTSPVLAVSPRLIVV